MISSMKINNILIYLFSLDNRIFIIKRINLPQFQEYFNKHSDSLIFMTFECKNDFFKAISSKDQISEQHDQILKEQKDINIAIKNEIIRCIIKKSQYRTMKMRQELLPDKFNSKNDQNYKLDDFIRIQSQGFYLCYNSKDQILNVLKYYEDEKRFNHEIDFYHQIENTFPFIRKIFGIIKQLKGLPIVIFEYVEGVTLNNFILCAKKIDFNIKIKMIEEILLSVYYVHSNGFYLRDLKPDNIIVDSNNDVILIDFDYSKKMYSTNKDNDENTGFIGNPVFIAPEQYNSNEYTYKVDVYSIGMIIHFIITRQKYNFDDYDLSEIYNQKENISKNNKFPKLPQGYEFILSIYEKCFEISPSSRPCIADIINEMLLLNQLTNENEIEIPYIINQLEKYESIFKIADKYMHEKPIERSYLQYFLGYIYYSCKYTSIDIDKVITQLVKASNQNNSDAQFLLGEIYYKGKYISRNINKSIHYLNLSANQNNSYAQYYLGKIYYSGKYISLDINKSIHYLTLSANQNNSYAQRLFGTIYYEGKYISRDINKSIHYLTLSANQNNSNAQCNLGEIYFLGEYILRDIYKSIHYLTLSANQNNANAQCILGEIYCRGEYISHDINKSIYYLTLSANQNNSDAQGLLGYYYFFGEDISRDINKSIHYLTLSSNQNNVHAQLLLGTIYYKGEYISRDINKSIHYLTLAANQNNSDAQFLLGEIYYFGKYISLDINKSIHYLTLSSNQYNSNAQCLLGEIYYRGEYISRDIIKSIHYFKESSCFYNSIAKNYLGIIYKNGDGVERNIYFAKIYFKEAIKQKEEISSMYNLARIYYFGIEHKRKISKAITLLEKASEKQLPIANLFLFYIYSNCDDKNFLDKKKSYQYIKKCKFNLLMKLRISNFNDYTIIINLHKFLRNNDLIRCNDNSYDLIFPNAFPYGKFSDEKIQSGDYNQTNNNESLKKDIDTDFYKGFNG